MTIYHREIHIYVQSIDHYWPRKVHISPNSTVLQLKEMIADAMYVSITDQLLQLNGTVMKDRHQLLEYGELWPGQVVHLEIESLKKEKMQIVRIEDAGETDFFVLFHRFKKLITEGRLPETHQKKSDPFRNYAEVVSDLSLMWRAIQAITDFFKMLTIPLFEFKLFWEDYQQKPFIQSIYYYYSIITDLIIQIQSLLSHMNQVMIMRCIFFPYKLAWTAFCSTFLSILYTLRIIQAYHYLQQLKSNLVSQSRIALELVHYLRLAQYLLNTSDIIPYD
ncbi:hypothetical protein BDB01DRAFT_312765 [Pilobolus umbonatus]|nr:hypothetical protein BDB01DRAFT_312765 [Pilobolus umbonatus]